MPEVSISEWDRFLTSNLMRISCKPAPGVS